MERKVFGLPIFLWVVFGIVFSGIVHSEEGSYSNNTPEDHVYPTLGSSPSGETSHTFFPVFKVKNRPRQHHITIINGKTLRRTEASEGNGASDKFNQSLGKAKQICNAENANSHSQLCDVSVEGTSPNNGN